MSDRENRPPLSPVDIPPPASNLPFSSQASDPSLRLTLALAWRDHLETREQGWKSLKMEGLLAVGLVWIDWQAGHSTLTLGAGLLVMAATYCGLRNSLHQRNSVMVRKFEHIQRCESKLKLQGYDLIDIPSGQLPPRLSFWDAFRVFRVHHTAAYLLRMHLALLLFATLLVTTRFLERGG